MNRRDQFERILASLHAAVFDDALWPATSGLIDDFCGVKGNQLVVGDGTARDGIDIFFSRFCYRGQRYPALEREYFETWHAVDERLPRTRALPDSRLVPTASLFSEDEKKSSVVYHELMPRADTRDSLTVRLDGPAGSRIVWRIADPVDEDGWTSERVEAVSRLLPHLRQFVRVRQALNRAGTLGAAAVELLGNVRVGVIELDRRGRVATANDRARALLHKGDRLSDEDGRLHASLPDEDATLQKLLARALPFLGGPGAGGSMLLSRSEPRARLALHVNPMLDARGEPGQASVGALVLAVGSTVRTGIDPARVGDALGLTRAESRVAVLLSQGKSIDDVAAETGRRPTTVKWHLRHIYAKCGIKRRMDLAELVTSLTEIPERGAEPVRRR